MTTLEAYRETIHALDELRELGVTVQIRPSKQRNNPELIARYNGPEHLPPDQWVNVTLKADLSPQFRAIAEKAKHLGWLGIYFDTGGMAGSRDWELDWSFTYTAGPDGEAEERREIVEDLISNVLEKPPEEDPS